MCHREDGRRLAHLPLAAHRGAQEHAAAVVTPIGARGARAPAGLDGLRAPARIEPVARNDLAVRDGDGETFEIPAPIAGDMRMDEDVGIAIELQGRLLVDEPRQLHHVLEAMLRYGSAPQFVVRPPSAQHDAARRLRERL
jgi:hypothetical protein